MAKEEGSKTVFLGGKKDVAQQYCGTVGGQSTDFSTIDTEIKVTYIWPHFSLFSFFLFDFWPFCVTLDNPPQEQFSCTTWSVSSLPLPLREQF